VNADRSESRVPTESGKVWKKLVIFQSGKAWENFFWSFGMEKGNNFPDLIF